MNEYVVFIVFIVFIVCIVVDHSLDPLHIDDTDFSNEGLHEKTDLSTEIVLPSNTEEEPDMNSHRLVRVRRFYRESIVMDVGDVDVDYYYY